MRKTLENYYIIRRFNF